MIVICVHTHIVGRPTLGFQRLLCRMLVILGIIALRPSEAPAAGQVAFIRSVMLCVPLSSVSH